MTDFIEKFDRKYAPKLGIRAGTFKVTLDEALERDVFYIVETGCIRKEDNWEGDGQSSIIWNDFIKQCHGKFTSIDISREATDLVRKLCPEAVVIRADSVATLKKYNGPIDLLYLDSFDVKMDAPHPAAMHCLFELCAAMPWLHPGSIILIDDSPMVPDSGIHGKALYVAKYMKHLGIQPFTTGYQAGWIMP